MKTKAITIALLATFLAGCSSPESFEDASPGIVQVNATGEYLNVRADMPRTGMPGEALDQLKDVAAAIAEGLKAGYPGPTAETRWVKIDARFGDGEFKDRFGTYIFGVDALKSFDVDAPTAQILNLVESVQPGSGDSVEETAKWCFSGNAFAEQNERFCSELAAAIASEQAR